MEYSSSEAIGKAIGAHGIWKMRLRTAIVTGRFDGTPDQVRTCDRCEFGHWLYGLDAATKQGRPFQVIERLHREFHDTAARVLECVEVHDSQAASSLLEGEFRERSEKLSRALNKWKNEAKEYA